MNTRFDDTQTGAIPSGKFARAYVVILPLAKLARAAGAVCVVLAAGLAGYWLSAGEAGFERLLAPAPMPETAPAPFELPEVVVNLPADVPSRYMKIGITLTVAPQERAEVERMLPYLMNALQDFLRNLSQQDLQGSAGLYRLRSELRRRFNLIIGREAVTDVLLRSLLTQ
ncbi:MAG TPA: flagellar basal body-associated FliL family protein [Azospirillum sp.]|nr:flagellar basal body-associated FliL family protein [Azospirillum sp.]